MALSIDKTLPNLSKLEPLDGTNYKHWSQKLLIFFKQLEVDCVLFSNLTEENNAFEASVAFPDGADKGKTNPLMKLASQLKILFFPTKNADRKRDRRRG